MASTPELKIGQKLNEGKTKQIFELVEQPGLVLVQSKDQITTGNAVRKDQMEGKAAIANKTTSCVFRLLQESGDGIPTVFVAPAGRSNGLGPVMSANTAYPVISCPPFTPVWGPQDVWSSVRMPSEAIRNISIRVPATDNPQEEEEEEEVGVEASRATPPIAPKPRELRVKSLRERRARRRRILRGFVDMHVRTMKAFITLVRSGEL